MATVNYTPGQILYVKSKYDEAYVSIVTGTAMYTIPTMVRLTNL